MIDAETKKAVRARLRRIAGQVQAVERMVDADRYCIDLMHQLAAVQAAIGKVGEVVLRSHVQTCVTDAVRSSDERECTRKVEELVAVFGRYKRIREQSP
jgi:DNA-binding FrmR family transcriptional regulator